MHFQAEEVCTDSYALSFATVVVRLCVGPLTSRPPGTVPFDARCFVGSPISRLAVVGMTRLGSSNAEVERAARELNSELNAADSPPALSSELLFIALGAIHLGPIATLPGRERLHNALVQARDFVNAAGDARVDDPEVQAAKRMRDSLTARLLQLQALLLDHTRVMCVVELQEWLCGWLRHHWAQGGELVRRQMRWLPEYAVEDVISHLDFALRSDGPEAVKLGGVRLEQTVTFLVDCMDGEDRVKNPHVRGYIPHVLALLLEQGHPFEQFPQVRPVLVTRLLDMYNNVEFGEDTVHVKYKTRGAIASLLKFLWSQESQRAVITAAQRSPLFNRFLNHVCSDFIYLQEEVCSKRAVGRHTHACSYHVDVRRV